MYEEDYFNILQVSKNAEPEVIKAAYVNLSKKYHPDNGMDRDREEKIRKINLAYEILSDPKAKEKYKKNYKNESRLNISQKEKRDIESVICSYFFYLSKNMYEDAYYLLSDMDKANIKRQEFVRWQELVAVTFKITDFKCELKDVEEIHKTNRDHIRYKKVAKAKIEIIEENLLMKRIEKDSFYKNIIFEKEKWAVYLGYSSIKSHIDKFNTLSMLQKNSSILTITKSTYYSEKEEFLKLLQREQTRYNRYGNQFSMVYYKLRPEYKKTLEDIISNELRALDFGCEWKENVYLIVLPETDERGAQKVAYKIADNMEKKGKLKKQSIKIRVKEQVYLTLEELFYNLLK